jgi:serine protease Do
VNAKFIPILLVLGLSQSVQGVQSLESELRKNGETVVAVFEEQRAVLQKSSAVIRDGRKELAYGVVISADGYILTKASEVAKVSAISVTVDEAKFDNAKVVATDAAWDVALLKIEAQGLQPIQYASSSDIPQGTWVVANGATSGARRRALPGIISAKPREIAAHGGAALGVVLKSKTKALEIEDVNEKSGAQEAGLQKGDVIVMIDGKNVSKIEEMAALMKDKKAGSTVKVTYKRAGKAETVDVRLAAKGELFAQKSRNDQMSGDYSSRRTGFPRVIQHDVLGNKESTGGPLLNLEGLCIGMNIARADRAQSFAIPVEELKEIAARLMK